MSTRKNYTQPQAVKLFFKAEYLFIVFDDVIRNMVNSSEFTDVEMVRLSHKKCLYFKHDLIPN